MSVYWWALGVAVALNADKILLGSFSLVRAQDSFDGLIPFAHSFLDNLLRYGIVSQSQWLLCGISSLTTPVPPVFLPIMLLPPYLGYLLLCLSMVFVAFTGMFLFLRDEFKCGPKACFIAALFFSSITADMPVLALSIPGIPLLVWCLERILDGAYTLKTRLSMYAFILLYFISASFVLTGPSALFFYLICLIFLFKARKVPRNVPVMILIWSLFFLINLPSLAELFSNLPDSHRGSIQSGLAISWFGAVRRTIFSTIPSLLGMLISFLYISSAARSERNRYFYFPIALIVFIYSAGFLSISKPFMDMVSSHLNLLKSARFEQLYCLLPVLFAILVGKSSDYLMKRPALSERRAWIVSICGMALYIGMGLKYNFFDVSASCGIKSAAVLISVIQYASLFIFLSGLWVARIRKYPIFTVLFASFVFFSLAITAWSRIYWGPENFYQFCGSPQIERIKAAEKGNLNNFRVVDLNGYHQSKLLNGGFKCADGYINVYPLAYKEFWIKVIEPELIKSKNIREYFIGTGYRVYLYYSGPKTKPIKELSFNPDLLRLINVKYIFTDEIISNCEKYGFMEVAAKSPGYIANEAPENKFKFKKYFSKREFYVYQNKYFASPVFLTGTFDSFPTKERLLDQLGKKDYAYLIKHTFVLKDDIGIMPPVECDAADSVITKYELTPDDSRVYLNNRYPVILNWTANYNKNWSCEIDGRPAPILRIYHSFMGVVVPANSHIVRFRYKNIYLNYAYLALLFGVVIINIYVIRYLKNIKLPNV